MFDLRSLRESKSLTQEQMSRIVGVSRPTYLRIETGRTEMTLSQAQKISQYFEISIEALATDIVAESENKIDKEKYIQILTLCIRYGSSEDGKITKTKLAKLAYLIDFAWFYNHLEPMTGLMYRRIKQGPVPDLFFSMIDSLQEDGLIKLELKGSAQLLENIEAPSDSKISSEEKEFIISICKKWQGKNTQEIVRFTHEQLPWKICHEDEIIPYELITQEEPTNVY